jgi:hypothetical protein
MDYFTQHYKKDTGKEYQASSFIFFQEKEKKQGYGRPHEKCLT